MGLRLYLRGLGIGIIVTALLMGYTLGGRKELSDAEIVSRAEALGMVDESKVLVQPSGKDEQEDAEAAPVISETDTAKEDESSPIAITGEADLPKEPENVVTDTEKDAADKADTDKEAGNEPEKDTEKETDGPETPDEGVNGESTRELSVSGAVKETEDSDKTEAQETPLTTEKEESGSDTVAKSETGTKAETDTGTKKDTDTDTAADTGKKTEADTKPDTDAGTGTKSKVTTVTIKKGSDSLMAAKELERAGVIKNASAFDSYLVSRKLDRMISSGSFKIPDGASDQEIARIITGR